MSLKKNIKRFKNIPDYIAGLDIEDVKKEYNLKRVIKLASNENPFPPSFFVRRKLKKFFKKVNLYPDMEYKVLRENIADFLNLEKENIIVGNGSDEIFDLIFKAFINKKDKIIYPAPSFAIYEILGSIYDTNNIIVNLDRNFYYPVKKIISLLKHNISLLILCNPNNPTGTYLTKTQIEEIIKSISTNTILAIDEAYFNFSESKDFPDMLSLFKKYKDKNIIVIRTFSKLYGMAGLRLGYAFSNKDIIKVLNKVRMPFNINLIAEKTALFYLKDKSVRKRREYLLNVKKYLYRELEKLNIEYIKSETNFVLIKLPVKSSIIFEKLLEKGIIVRAYTSKRLRNFIRVTIGRKKEIKLFLRELKKILQ